MNDDISFSGLHLFQTAAFYDLEQKSERNRSVSDLERFFFRLCGIIQPDLFIEAGARDASTSIRARRHLEEARIVAFEANPLNYSHYASNPRLKTGTIEYLHKALGTTDGTLSFHIRVIDGQEIADGQSSLLQKTEEASKSVTLPSVRLDTFFPAGTFKNACIWMDVEGATKQVLTGSAGILNAVDVLFVEVEDKPLWEGQWLSYDVWQFLDQAGFTPVARDFQSRYQYNLLFIRRPVLNLPRIRFALSEHISRVGSKTSLKDQDKATPEARLAIA